MIAPLSAQNLPGKGLDPPAPTPPREQCPNAFISKFEGASLTHVINVQGSRTQKLLNTQGIYSVVSAELKRRYPGLVAFMLDKKTVWCDKLDREFAKELKFTYLQ